MDAATLRTWGCVTDVGRQRQGNEDAHGEAEGPDGELLLVVCDGVGGHEAGEVASAVAVEAIKRVVVEQAAVPPPERLALAIRAANEAVLAEGERTGRREMGTTAVAAIVRSSEAWVGHVGDSRLYQFRRGEAVFRTRDHTRVRRLIDAGLISERAAKDHPEAHVLVRALGRREGADGRPVEAEVTTQPLRLEPGDALVLCSDGLHDVHDDEAIWETISGKPAAEAAQALVDSANDRGGPDNVTATVLVFGSERVPAGPARPATDEPAPIPPRRSNRALVWAAAAVITALFAQFVYGRSAPPAAIAAPDASVALEPPPAVDAAVQASAAGLLDASMSASPADADLADAGLADAGAEDAGLADAGVEDAGLSAPQALDAGGADGG